ncbi:MAG: hypothetical protein FJW37_02735 [Acidobacteria bacterium]|nr:hypothetical protein [Acidobacteriota bacterium]
MKPFHFRLERVLAWRKTQLEIEKARAARLAAEMRECALAIERLEAERVASGQELLGQASVEGWSLAALAGYRTRLGMAGRRLEAQRQDFERRYGEQRSRVIEAQQRSRLLEKLKGRQHAEHQQESGKELEPFSAENYLAQWTPPRPGKRNRPLRND